MEVLLPFLMAVGVVQVLHPQAVLDLVGLAAKTIHQRYLKVFWESLASSLEYRPSGLEEEVHHQEFRLAYQCHVQME